MGKNVEVTLKFGTTDTTFLAEPEKWSEKRNTVKVTRKPLGPGQREIERTEVASYELSFSGAKVSDHMTKIVAIMDSLNAEESSLDEDTISVVIEITNPNNATIEKRTYTKCQLSDPGTNADDLEGNVEESFTIVAKYRKVEIDGKEITSADLGT
jgi:hypothetical protein